MTLFNQNRPINVVTYTLATLPTASEDTVGDLIIVSDANSGVGALCFGSATGTGSPLGTGSYAWIDAGTGSAVA